MIATEKPLTENKSNSDWESLQPREQLSPLMPNTSMPDHDWWEALWSEPGETLQALGLTRGMSVLDLGCGYGHFTIPAARLVNPAPAVGIDIDSPILAEARKAGEEVVNCLWLNQDLLSLPKLMVSKFDYVMMHCTFHGLPDPVEFLRSVVDVLNPGGYFSVINWLPIPREETIWLGKPRGPKTEVRISLNQLLSIVETATVSLSPVQQLALPPYHYGVTFQLSL